jgi:hypothetical protein
MKRLLLFLPALLLGLALAQTDVVTIPGVTVPDSIWYVAAMVIGLIVKAVASPLTQLLKTRLGFKGNVTRLLYAGLSLVFVAGFGALTGAFGAGGHGWLSAGTALLVALVKGYGDYSKLVETSTVGSAAALPAVIVTAAPQVLHPIGTPGTEPLHDAGGIIIGAVMPLTPSTPSAVPANGLEPLQ